MFPRYKMIPQNVWQEEFMHYPKQQECCIDILDFMQSHGACVCVSFSFNTHPIHIFSLKIQNTQPYSTFIFFIFTTTHTSTPHPSTFILYRLHHTTILQSTPHHPFHTHSIPFQVWFQMMIWDINFWISLAKTPMCSGSTDA